MAYHYFLASIFFASIGLSFRFNVSNISFFLYTSCFARLSAMLWLRFLEVILDFWFVDPVSYLIHSVSKARPHACSPPNIIWTVPRHCTRWLEIPPIMQRPQTRILCPRSCRTFTGRNVVFLAYVVGKLKHVQHHQVPLTASSPAAEGPIVHLRPPPPVRTMSAMLMQHFLY